MEKNLDIEILKTSNGFFVRPKQTMEGYYQDIGECKCFQSMEEMILWIRQHFFYRDIALASDDQSYEEEFELE